MLRSRSLLLFSALLLLAQCGDLVGEQLTDAAAKQALCNDGTAPVYYKHLVEDSTEWLIYLEGGGGCFSEEDCLKRYKNSPSLMTASFDVIPRQLTLEGVLSLDCNVNPHFCKANIFFVHYCSSDLYVGEREYPYQDFIVHFNGKRIVDEVVKQIVSLYSQISQATRIILGGASAGSVGTQINGDRIGERLAELIPEGKFDYRLLPDSGWFLPGPSLRHYPCSEHYCNIEYSIFQGTPFINAQYSEACLSHYSEDQKAYCFFLSRQYTARSIKTPAFFVFNFHDSYQMASDGILNQDPASLTKWDKEWVTMTGQETIDALDRLKGLESKHGLFVPDCIDHVLTMNNKLITELKVKETSFNEALGEWLKGEVTVYLESDCGDTIACNPNCRRARASQL